MQILTVAQREIKLGFRNVWTYSFLILLSLFTMVIFLLQSGVPAIKGFTDMTGTMMNITLYILPLMTLILGGMSATDEKEGGQWGLLSTYPISAHAFLWGKWIGLSIVFMTVLLFSFGLAGVISVVFGQSVSLELLIFFWLFSTVLSLVYLGISLMIGAWAKNRWQSLIGAIIVWFVTILIWPVLMISTLSHLPSFNMVQPMLQLLTLFNPAEWLRIFSIMSMGSGSIFGASYDQWITWSTSQSGFIFFIGLLILWIVTPLLIGGMLWNRGDQHGQ